VSGLERDPACHPERLAVILSEAKDLSARRARPFAEFTLSEANGLGVTGLSPNVYCLPMLQSSGNLG
jgi:hypothetical protein